LISSLQKKIAEYGACGPLRLLRNTHKNCAVPD
jgi:hypothetical protein